MNISSNSQLQNDIKIKYPSKIPLKENFKYNSKKIVKEKYIGKDLYEDIIEFDKKNYISSISRYKNNELHGESLNYSNGYLEQKILYEDGKRNGPLEIFRNGFLSLCSQYKNDQLDGKTIYFYETGIHNKTLNYIENKINGLSICFYENGSIMEIVQYKNDNKNGIYKTYHENGKILETGQYKENKKVGEFIKYYPNGNILEKEQWGEDGIKISSEVFNIDGSKSEFPKSN